MIAERIAGQRRRANECLDIEILTHAMSGQTGRYFYRAGASPATVGDQLAGGGFVGPYPPSATRASARKSADGSSLPRFTARRRIPRPAFQLK